MSTPWPTRFQEQLLTASLGAGSAAERALEYVLARRADDFPDPAALQLLPFLYRRWPSLPHPLIETGQKAYLSNWSMNRKRLSYLSELVSGLRNCRLQCMVLKGAALALKYYKDPGLRGMRDVDIMVPAHSLARAIQIVCDMGYVAERNLATSSILRRARVSHAWQFLRAGQSCDLHWRPIVRCFAPEIPAAFWEGAEPACVGGMEFLVPCPTDQLLHVCVHGLQWDWEPSVRWVADALIVAREPIQWDRICELSEKAHIRDRLSRALRYLRARFGMLVPAVVIERLSSNVAAWEQRDADILLKPCPLGLRDSLEWHLNNFRRIRLADPKWHTSPGPIGFVQYLVTFLDADGSIHLAAKLWPEMKRRVNKQNT